jgi:hypothetical protein
MNARSVSPTVTAYSDDSGAADNPSHSVISVAANLCKGPDWSKFDADWTAVLRRFDVPYLHMREWVNPNSPIYKHLRPPEAHADFFGSLVNVIIHHIRYSAGASVNIHDLRQFSQDVAVNLDPYAFALYATIIELRKAEPNSEIKLIVDRLNSARSKIKIAEHYARTDAFDLKTDAIEIRPLSKEESFRIILPIQVGDFFAWEMRKSCEERKTFVPTDTATSNFSIHEAEHHVWEEQFFRTNRRMPHIRKSAFRLMTLVKQSGEYFNYRRIKSLHQARRPHQWG